MPTMASTMTPSSFQAVNKVPFQPNPMDISNQYAGPPVHSMSQEAPTRPQTPPRENGVSRASFSNDESLTPPARATKHTMPDTPQTPANADDDGEGVGRAKKKKGQRFFCRGYGDCNLSFTRSEHLARHIRKHTGERPFTCHCGRSFSRLDNLRQHSQTVHADEVIPQDSLAATGTRYQRHVKTERIVARREKGSSISAGEGNSRPSSMSGTEAYSAEYGPAAKKHRPGPILLPSGSQSSNSPRVSFDDFRGSTPPPDSPASSVSSSTPFYRERQQPYPPVSNSSQLTTPTSSSFGIGQSPMPSPSLSHYSSSTLGSPFPSSRRERRGSMPASSNPFNFTAMNLPPPPTNPHAGFRRGHRYTLSATGTGMGGLLSSFSTTSITSPMSPRKPPRDVTMEDAYEPSRREDPRRRTWHPGTYENINYGSPAMSGSQYSSYAPTPQDQSPTTLPPIRDLFGANRPGGPARPLSFAGQSNNIPTMEPAVVMDPEGASNYNRRMSASSDNFAYANLHENASGRAPEPTSYNRVTTESSHFSKILNQPNPPPPPQADNAPYQPPSQEGSYMFGSVSRRGAGVRAGQTPTEESFGLRSRPVSWQRPLGSPDDSPPQEHVLTPPATCGDDMTPRIVKSQSGHWNSNRNSQYSETSELVSERLPPIDSKAFHPTSAPASQMEPTTPRQADNLNGLNALVMAASEAGKMDVQ